VRNFIHEVDFIPAGHLPSLFNAKQLSPSKRRRRFLDFIREADFIHEVDFITEGDFIPVGRLLTFPQKSVIINLTTYKGGARMEHVLDFLQYFALSLFYTLGAVVLCGLISYLASRAFVHLAGGGSFGTPSWVDPLPQHSVGASR
jgi:hypothetical protein